MVASNTITLNARYRFATTASDFCAGLTLNDTLTLLDDLDYHSKVYLIIAVGALILTTLLAFIGCVYIRVFKRMGLYIVNKEEPFGRRFIVYLTLVNGIYFWVTLAFGDNAFSKFSG